MAEIFEQVSFDPYNFGLLLFFKISFLLLCWLFSVVHESHAVFKMPLVSNSLKDYGVLEVKQGHPTGI